MAQKRVIVVGAGIIGAAIAWHLARAGSEVTVIDAGEPGGVATGHSWAWINASWGNPEPYFRLRERSMLEWRQLDRDVPGLEVDWCGGLLWDLPPEPLEAYAREHGNWGYGIRRLNRQQVLEVEPNIRTPPDFALHVAEEGKVEPLATARALLAGAKGLGATILGNSPVKWLVEEQGRVAGVAVADGVLHADEVVVAAGVGAKALLAGLGLKIDLTAPPGLLVHSTPAGELLRGLVMTPELHVRQTSEGRLVAGTDFVGSFPIDEVKLTEMRLFRRMKDLVAGSEGLDLAFSTIGYRPTPADGFPLIGRPHDRPGLYLAVTHSGITLAAAVGLFVCAELLHGHRDSLLSPYHPDRLTTAA